MSGSTLFPFSRTSVMVGFITLIYGLFSVSPFLILQGGVLVWLGVATTMSVWEGNRLEN
jgi:hypothetical protein